jgi:PAS domain S-box-containing protein
LSNHPYSQLFELSPIPAVVTRLDDHSVLAVNVSAAELVGVSPNAVIGQPVSGYYVDAEQRLELIERVRRDGRADNVRLHIKRARGEPLWVLASIRVIDWNGEPASLTVFHNISDQLTAEASLKANERRLSAQSDALTDLTTRYTSPGESFDSRLRGILPLAAGALRVERAEPVEVHRQPFGNSLRRSLLREHWSPRFRRHPASARCTGVLRRHRA